MQYRLNFIGCGQLGKALGSLWHNNSAVIIGDVLTRSMSSAKIAVATIGAGKPVDSITTMQRADIYLVACADDDIEPCSQQLADSGLLLKNDVVFHCSGSQSSALLQACQDSGAFIASIHPIKSFANPVLAIQSFAGTYCGVEGDESALTILSPIFTAIGANLVAINAKHKTLYHAASVIASNYLVTLQEISLQTFEKAGVSRQEAMAILQPIVNGTVDNVFRLGTTAALTGPIARGDAKVVGAQLSAMEAWDEELAALYRQLGLLSLPLANGQGNASAENLAVLRSLFKPL